MPVCTHLKTLDNKIKYKFRGFSISKEELLTKKEQTQIKDLLGTFKHILLNTKSNYFIV